eukprot:TRINITY_DN2989_c5_g1_i1.p2 TRINITY_DN2989_c5_g1~~TRINITY_DN2989_c5_g1_i1.p2  ORF type:complete len:397 (+),score=200.46 TRINITY_DN2989_c5_g1_i1:83-1192(+)
MTLEATYICVDNSETMRNGDFAPTRLQAVTDACNVLCGAKTQMNPENGVGFLTMADASVKIVETLTPDLGRLLAALTAVKPGGKLDLVKGLQVGQLGLKHRMNKNQRQRIIAFVGSRVGGSEKELVQLAKKLKKHSVSVDIVAFGCEENVPLLKKFVETVNSKQQDRDTSHLLEVHEGQSIADALLSSPILNPDGTNDAAGAAAGGDMFGGYVDPELAMVLRMSMEEERARQERARQAEGGGDAAAPAEPEPAAAAAAADAPMPDAAQPSDILSPEEAAIQRAIQMSMEEAGIAPEEPAAAEEPAKQEDVAMDEAELTEEQQMELALKLSMQENTDPELDAMMEDEALDAQLASELGIGKKEEEKKEEK